MGVYMSSRVARRIQARLKAVVGIDYSVDNIENQLDGACTRYLKEKQKKYALKASHPKPTDSKFFMSQLCYNIFFYTFIFMFFFYPHRFPSFYRDLRQIP
jgi:hypothetical protein